MSIFFHMFGTGLFHYGTYDSSFTHVYSAACVALLILLALQISEGSTRRRMVAAAIIAFLLVLLRQTNVFVVSWIGVGVAWLGRSPLAQRIAFVATILISCLIGTAVLIGYNSYGAGAFTLSSYGDEMFVWTRPMWRSVLFSFERGLFTYYPVLLISVATSLFSRITRRYATVAVGCIFSYALFYGFWHSWFLGGGFGHRGFVEPVPAIAVMAATAVNSLASKSRTVVLVLMAIACGLTLSLMWGYWTSTLPIAGTNSSTYIAQFSWSRLPIFLAPMCVLVANRFCRLSSAIMFEPRQSLQP